jgi:hypothetical protein
MDNFVFGEGKYEVKHDNGWYGLISAHCSSLCGTQEALEMTAQLMGWHHGFVDVLSPVYP